MRMNENERHDYNAKRLSTIKSGAPSTSGNINIKKAVADHSEAAERSRAIFERKAYNLPKFNGKYVKPVIKKEK